MTVEYEIVRLGAQGDGVAAEGGEGVRFVPFALPGERVRLSSEGAFPEIVETASPERVAPLCRHFGACGGCVAQHMSRQLYAEWKRAIVADSLHRQRLETVVAPLRRVEPGSRRRAVLTARRDNDGVVRLGYHRRKSAEIIHITECPILVPDIVQRLPALRAIAEAIPKQEMRLTVLATSAGLDVALDHAVHTSGAALIGRLAALAGEHGIARISAGGMVIVERAKPSISLGGTAVVPPPGGFVQAAEAAETEIAQLILDATSRSKRVADLFCGVGTWALPIARHARVLAVDGDRAAIDALMAAAQRTEGLKPIEAKWRDLFREPLSAQELKGFDAVVFDPPRAGARAQVEKIARSQVGVVVAVSCDPATLARDLRILVDGGYAIKAVTPIDQFVFSAHVEAVAVLRRDN